MPDVTRSDSQRSDTSLRPRVSFNRDVHVKRIVPREGVRSLGALSGDGNGHLVASPVRKERLKRSKKELADEAAQVLHRVDKLNCVTKPSGASPEKFYTLPRRRNENPQDNFSSIDRRWARRNKFDAETPPKKPQRTFAATKASPEDSKSSVLDLFKNKPKKSNLRRSVSDASSKERPRGDDASRNSLSDYEDNLNGPTYNKKQLSPIIEVTQREDYFSENKENDGNNLNEEPRRANGFDDEVDASRLKKGHGIVIIDIDKAKVSGGGKKNSLIGRKLKSLGKRKKEVDKFEALAPHPPPARIQGAIDNLQKRSNPKMIHSSQKPVEKLPLTKGRTVDSMVRRLNNDICTPPPKPNVMVTPNISVQHNNNQPFSYTRGLSPEKCMSDENLQNSGRPIIYAQVVCQNGRSGPAKQTIHTVYSKKQQHSDSDEGLGNEENLSRNKYKSYTRFGDELKDETPIMPKYRVMSNYEDHQVFIDSSARGRADGMDAKRRESLTEDIENNRNDISTRRDMLESRINRRIHSKFNKSGSSSPKGYRYDKSFDSDYRSSPEDKYETSHHTRRYEENSSTMQRNVYKSTPDIYRNGERATDYNNSYSNSSLRRDHQHNGVKRNDKDRFGDSGIENDSIRRDTIHKYNGNNHYESEDEGFASSLLIASERQHTEEAQARRFPKKDYDSDRAYSGEDDPYRNMEHMEYKVMRNVHSEYAPRERSIDDGSHFDPRIDGKEFLKERSTLEKNVMKPPKPEKKSSLEKVKQLFSRDTKKKKGKQEMVREESLRARYTEYKGSREHLEPPKKSSFGKESEDSVTGYDYSNRRRLSTPSPSPTREPANDKPDNSYTNWFKSLDRLSRKKSKKEPVITKTVNGDVLHGKPKNLRFFGDTDADSSDGARISSRNKGKPTNASKRSQSSRELHNITEENNELNKKNNNYHHHKSLTNISNSPKKPPVSPNRRSNSREPSRSRLDDKSRRRKYEISSVESSTEGDSSQQSQRSIVYLHAATVGDIPGPGRLRFNGKRASSREELASNDSGRIQQSKTLSRSFSVLAPWKPRFQHEGTELDYSQYPKPTKNGKFEQRPIKNGISRKENSTLKRKAQERNNGNATSSTLSRTSRSKENVSKYKDERGSSSTLYKKKERLPRENSRYNRERDDKKMSAKSMSVESLKSSGNGKYKNGGGTSRDISRSVSMPKDPEKSAGWFKLSNTKKTHKSDYNMHRL